MLCLVAKARRCAISAEREHAMVTDVELMSRPFIPVPTESNVTEANDESQSASNAFYY